MDKDTVFWNLLRSGLWGNYTCMQGIQPMSEVEWNQLLTLARQQTVSGIVMDTIGHLPADVQPSSALKMKMINASMGIIKTNIKLNHTLAEVNDYYASQGLNGVVLKGQGIVEYYPNPQLRQCGDIDYYIGDGDFDRAVRLAMQHWPDYEYNERQVTYKHFAFKIGDVSIELHRNAAIAKRPWLKKEFENWLSESLGNKKNLRLINTGETLVYAPANWFDAFYIFFHAFSHLIEGEGIGLRQLCDWAMVLNSISDSEQQREVAAIVKRFGLERPWSIMGHIVVDKLGLPKEKMPLLNDKYLEHSQRLLKQILEGGNFGKYKQNKSVRPKSYWGSKFYTFRTLHANLTRMWYLSPSDMFGTYIWLSLSGLRRAITHSNT